jgi:hypothetical protein
MSIISSEVTKMSRYWYRDQSDPYQVGEKLMSIAVKMNQAEGTEWLLKQLERIKGLSQQGCHWYAAVQQTVLYGWNQWIKL